MVWNNTTPTQGIQRGNFIGLNRFPAVPIPVPIGVNYVQQRVFWIAFQKRLERREQERGTGYTSYAGWKIHVAAYPFTAAAVAALVLPALCQIQVWHKYATLDGLSEMRGEQAGKFITVYPNPADADGAHGWRTVLQAITNALSLAQVEQPRILDPREVFTSPDNQPLPRGVSMRHVDDFSRG